ncbi:MAG: SpoIIE family protein phosphatase [Phycisphaera sp.]|nr:SpoIIE family protein phosphatase [Phycisphaera sp.]
MDQARSTTRIAVVSTEAMLTVAEDWRNRITREMPGVTAVHLCSEVLRTPAGTPMHLDVEVIVVFAGEDRAAAESALKATLDAVEPPESENALPHAVRIVAVSDLVSADALHPGYDAIPVGAADAELVPFLRGILACAPTLRDARRELALLNRFVGSMRNELEERNEELQLAALVQRDFLPLPVPELHGVQVATFYRPLAQVSGDVYHVEQLDDDRLSIFIADAVGHGIPAALLGMAVCRSLETTERVHGQLRLLGPGETLARANVRLAEHQRATTRFATAIAAVLDCRQRTIRLAAAGHPPAILLRPGEAPRHIECDGGLLGIFPDEVYGEIELALEPHDKLLFYSDGFEQAFTDDGSPSHFKEFAALTEIDDPETVVQEIAARIDAQSGSLHQADDLTLLCISVGETAAVRLAA